MADRPRWRILVLGEGERPGVDLAGLLGDRYSITTVQGIPAAMAVASGASADLAIVEPSVARAAGFRFIELLAAADLLMDLPVVVLLDDGDSALAATYLLMGVDHCLVGPPDVASFPARIRGAIDKQRQRTHRMAGMRKQHEESRAWNDKLLDQVIPIGASMVQETDYNRLLERIVVEAMTCCDADGGTLYLRTPQDTLEFAIMRTRSLGIELGGTTGRPIPFGPLPLRDPATGAANHRSVATHAALAGRSVNVPDVYLAEDHDYDGAKHFDASTGYRSKSLLTVPLKDDGGRVIGVLQLLNSRDASTGQVSAFTEDMQRVVEGLARLAGVGLQLYARQQKLREQVRELRVEVDEARKTKQVEAIMGTDYFQDLRSRAHELRKRAAAGPGNGAEA